MRLFVVFKDCDGENCSNDRETTVIQACFGARRPFARGPAENWMMNDSNNNSD